MRPDGSATLKRLVRDVAIALALVMVTWQSWNTAAARAPQFQMADIEVLEAEIAGFTRIDVAERSASPRNNSTTIRSRSALQLVDYPPNLVFYLRGSIWEIENDVPIGTAVRLEVVADLATAAARARAYPDTIFGQPLAGLAIGDDVRLSASETVARAEAASDLFRRVALIVGVAAIGWIGWAGWRWRSAIVAGS